jgi:hypothetical protein
VCKSDDSHHRAHHTLLYSISSSNMEPWVILSTKWKLEDVQAGLNVIVTVLCVTSVVISSQFSGIGT